MRLTRALIGTAGIAFVLVGAWHLYEISTTSIAKVVDIAVWLAAGVLLHDGVIAPLVIVGALVLLRLRVAARAPVIAGLVVLLSVTLTAVPVLGRFGERPDVPSLLNRPYGLLWLGFAVVVLLTVIVTGLLRGRASGTHTQPETAVHAEAAGHTEAADPADAAGAD